MTAAAAAVFFSGSIKRAGVTALASTAAALLSLRPPQPVDALFTSGRLATSVGLHYRSLQTLGHQRLLVCWPECRAAQRHFCPSASLQSATASISDQSQNPGAQTESEKQMTKDALDIIAAAISSVNPRSAIKNCLLPLSNVDNTSSSADGAGIILKDPSAPSSIGKIVYRGLDYDEVKIVSFGKASSAMALQTAQIVKEAMPHINLSGIAIVKDDHATKEESDLLPKYSISIREASHPIPDSRSIAAATEVLDLVSAADERTLVICCISGGGSALFCAPRPPLTLDDIAQTNQCLLASGMSIDNMNIIRKRLELGKGGRLAEAAYPSTVAGLVLSDIVGDPLDLIASGPTVPDRSTWDDALDLIQKFGLGRGSEYELPKAVLDMMDQGVQGALEDTPDTHPAFSTTRPCSLERANSSMLTETILVGNNELAVTSAAKEADRLGYNAKILGCTVEGESKDVAGVFSSLAEQLAKQRTTASSFSVAPLPAAIVAGGETTVTLGSATGKGGRNQEIGLKAALDLKSKNLRDVVIASAGTDGTDGPTDCAGALVDGGTVDRIEHMSPGPKGEDSLLNHDAYHFLSRHCEDDPDDSAIQPLIFTGPTGTNVADVCVILVR